MRALIDTCIVIDLLQKREPFFDDAHKVFLSLANRQYEGYISAKSVADIHYLMHHFLHDEAKTRKALETLFKLFSVLDTTELDCKKATLSPVSDYEDAIMAETALRSGMDCIVTRNLKDYEKSSVQARSPADFMQEIIGPDEEE